MVIGFPVQLKLPCWWIGVVGDRLVGRQDAFEPHAFLLAWVEAGGLFEGPADHIPHRPSAADVAEAHRRHHLA